MTAVQGPGAAAGWVADEKAYYDAQAGEYIEAEERPHGWKALEALLLFRHINFRADPFILNLGCGPSVSVYSELLPKFTPRTRYLGLDISRGLLAHSRQRMKESRSSFAQADLLSLPLRDAPFADVALLLGVLHHIPDSLGVIGAAARALKPGGLLLMREPNERAFVRWSGDSPHEYGIPEQALAEACRETGLEVVRLHLVNSLFTRRLERSFAGRALRHRAGWRAKVWLDLAAGAVARRLGLSDYWVGRDTFIVARKPKAS